MNRAFQIRHTAYFVLVCIFCLIANKTGLTAETTSSMNKALDGMKFVGETGEQGKKSNNPDTITFEAGKFRSTSCEGHGFGPAPYTVEKQGDTYMFSATLTSSDTGTLDWTGTIIGGKLEASFRWKHKRWFWNIERDYWYKGTR